MIPWTFRRFPNDGGVPRTRGDDPHIKDGEQFVYLVFPAHAGMIPARTDFPTELDRVPRTRGDDPRQPSTPGGRRLCSPHTRG